VDITLSQIEIDCIKKLAAKLESGNAFYGGGEESLDLPPEKRDQVLTAMESYGAIENVQHMSSQKFKIYYIAPRVTQLARAIETKEAKAKEPKDIVNQMSDIARKSPASAWIIIAFFVVTALVVLINNAVQLAQNIGWMKSAAVAKQ